MQFPQFSSKLGSSYFHNQFDNISKSPGFFSSGINHSNFRKSINAILDDAFQNEYRNDRSFSKSVKATLDDAFQTGYKRSEFTQVAVWLATIEYAESRYGRAESSHGIQYAVEKLLGDLLIDRLSAPEPVCAPKEVAATPKEVASIQKEVVNPQKEIISNEVTHVTDDEITEHVRALENTLKSPNAATKIGNTFYDNFAGLGAKANDIIGHFYVQAAEDGDAEAAFRLAGMAENFENPSKANVPTFASSNPKATALKYYQIAATLGHESAKLKVLELESHLKTVHTPTNNEADKKHVEKEKAAKAKELIDAQIKHSNRLHAANEESMREADKTDAKRVATTEKIVEQHQRDSAVDANRQEVKHSIATAKAD